MDKKSLSIIVCLFVSFCLPASAQRGNFDDVIYKVTDLGNGIHMLEGSGGNIGLSIGKDGAFLIDDQFAPLAPKLLAAIEELTNDPVTFVVNTHWHGDHTGGNANLAETGSLIVAHENVRTRMSAEGKKQSPPEALPVITFSDTNSYHLNGLTIKASHVAHAHTDGDAIVEFIGANVIHAGDILFNGIYPFIDLESGGSVNGFLTAMEKLASMADDETRIIAGHGPLAGKEDVLSSIQLVKEVKSRISALVAKGKSLEEVLELDPLADLNDDYSWAFISGERITEIVFRDVSGN